MGSSEAPAAGAPGVVCWATLRGRKRLDSMAEGGRDTWPISGTDWRAPASRLTSCFALRAAVRASSPGRTYDGLISNSAFTSVQIHAFRILSIVVV